MPAARRAIAAGSLLGLCLAGCVTAYQPLGATGGYKDEKLEDDTYRVSFFGNGNTPRPVVLKYFLYRCAELTLEHTYEYFEIFNARRVPPRHSRSDSPFIKVRTPSYVPSYTYVPGAAITRWSATGVVRMYPKNIMSGSASLFNAHEVADLLGPEVRSGTPGNTIPERLRRIEGAFPAAPADAAATSSAPPPPATGGPVQLDDLKDLMTK